MDLALHAYGCSLTRLLEELVNNSIDIPGILWTHARELDRFYVPARYPNAWAEGSPFEYYALEDARKAIYAAEQILNWVESTWRLLEEGLRKERRS